MRGGTGRRRHAWPAGLAALGVTAGAVACVDLFHSTDFGEPGGVCDEAGVCVSADAAGDGAGARRKDGGAEAGRGDGGSRDGTVDHGGEGGGGGSDAKGDGKDASPAIRDAGEASVPQPTFCALSQTTAASYAEHACRLLGACVGNFDLNEYGVCYTNALLAYDCSLNPSQRVRGALYTYWEALSKATTCQNVLDAIFPQGVPPCTSAGASCGPDISLGGLYANVVTVCGDAGFGGFASAVNCQMRGYTCVAGVCGNGGAACTAPTAGCAAGNTLRSCQLVEIDAGTATALVDVGRDCTNFGAGSCVEQAATGAYGCLPNDASLPCEASTAVTCSLDGGAFATGCASGFRETVSCSGFAEGTTCSADGGWAASSRDLVGGCYNPAVLDTHAGPGACTDNGFLDNAGPSGVATVVCMGPGFVDGGCRISATDEPFCPR